LSIFPFLILAISLLCNYSLYIYNFLDSLVNILPMQVYNIIYGVVGYALGSCGKPYLTISMLIILWSATSGSATIINGINTAYGFNIKKNYITLRLRGLLFTLAFMFSMQLIFAVIVAGRSFLILVKKISTIDGFNFAFLDSLRYFVAFFFIFIILSAAYKFLPYEKIKLSRALPGGIFSSISFIAGSNIYSHYVSSKIFYINSIYGNLSGFLIFIIWIYILSVIFFIGAEINYFVTKIKG